MRKLILQMQYSLDGCVAGPNGALDWIFPDLDAEVTRWEVERLWEAGAHLMGSVTYGEMARHWPTSTEPVAPAMNQIPKIVFSAHLQHAAWGETRIIAEELAPAVARLKRESGRDLLAHGGVRFARSLIRSGLVDEYVMMMHPIVLGEGLRPFSDLGAPIRLQLVNEKRFANGLIALLLRPS